MMVVTVDLSNCNEGVAFNWACSRSPMTSLVDCGLQGLNNGIKCDGLTSFSYNVPVNLTSIPLQVLRQTFYLLYIAIAVTAKNP